MPSENTLVKLKSGKQQYNSLTVIPWSQVAVKVINKTELKDTDYIMRNLHREADVLRKIRHTNIVQLYEVMIMTY